jgi:hypothetical protein
MGDSLKGLLLAAVFLFVVADMRGAQSRTLKISLTASSNVSTAEVGKSLDARCPDVIVTADPEKADFRLEAIYTGAGAARKPYKFTLFNHDSDRVFSTATSRVDNAVKDVCTYIQKHKP